MKVLQLKEAANIMTEKRISSLIVERENVPIGIITEKDFVKKICNKDTSVLQC